MSNSTRITTIAGIPIRVHISLWIVLPLIAFIGPFSEGQVPYPLAGGLAFAVLLFVCIALHELGHSLVAINKGVTVRQILLTPIGGIAMMDQMPDKPSDEILIAAAGPATSLLLAMFFGFLSMFFHLTPACGDVFTVTEHTVIALAFGNLVIALFNLLPSFPMDGGRIFRAWMVPKVGKLEATRRAAKVGRIIAVALGIVGIASGSFSLILIAIFVYFSAAAEFRATQFKESFMKTVFSNTGGRPAPNKQTQADETSGHASFKSSPPPYTRTQSQPKAQSRKNRINSVFDDLYSDWK